MRVGKKTYIKELSKQFLKDKAYEIINCYSQSGMATEQVCFKLNDIINIKFVYSPYDTHRVFGTFEEARTNNDDIARMVYRFQRGFSEDAIREFDNKDDFEKFITELLSYLPGTFGKLIDAIDTHIKTKISKGSLKVLLSDEKVINYMSKMDLSIDEINKIYEYNNDDRFLPADAREMFLF